jgi:hypothetical protein
MGAFRRSFAGDDDDRRKQAYGVTSRASRERHPPFPLLDNNANAQASGVNKYSSREEDNDPAILLSSLGRCETHFFT